MTEKEATKRIKDHFEIHNDGRPTPYLRFFEVKPNNTAVECKIFRFPADDEVEGQDV